MGQGDISVLEISRQLRVFSVIIDASALQSLARKAGAVALHKARDFTIFCPGSQNVTLEIPVALMPRKKTGSQMMAASLCYRTSTKKAREDAFTDWCQSRWTSLRIRAPTHDLE